MRISRWIVQDANEKIPFDQRRCLFWSDEIGRFVMMRAKSGTASRTFGLLMGQASFDTRKRAENALAQWNYQGAIPEPPHVPTADVKIIELRITVHDSE